MLINDNNICNVKFRGEDAVALYFGATLVWQKDDDGQNTVSYLTVKGNFVKNTTDADRWLYYNGEKHYIETNEFEIEFDSPITFRTKLTDSTPFASDKIENIIVPYIDNLTDISCMFENCYKLKSLDLSAVDTSNVTDMFGMCNGCEKLETLNLGDFNMGKVKTTVMMFYNCSSLTSLDLSDGNASNVTDMTSMFQNCSSLTSLDLSDVNANNVTDMSYMFSDCTSLTSINLTNFGTGGALKLNRMFAGCSSLSSLDLSTFNTLNVENMQYMFFDCTSLETLNIDGWDFRKVKDLTNIFSLCSSLTTVIGEFEEISVSIELNFCPLTRESALAFINGLKRNIKRIITFKNSTYSSLSEEDIALATSKGWTVASR